MRSVFVIACAIALAGCNQTTRTAEFTAGPAVAPASMPVASSSRAEMAAAPVMAPLYEPQIDMRGVNRVRLRRDMEECRADASPHEARARKAVETQQTGAAIQAVGAVASLIPIPGFRHAHIVAGAAEAVSSAGASTAANAAESQAQATEAYVRVINECLTSRRYRVL